MTHPHGAPPGGPGSPADASLPPAAGDASGDAPLGPPEPPGSDRPLANGSTAASPRHRSVPSAAEFPDPFTRLGRSLQRRVAGAVADPWRATEGALSLVVVVGAMALVFRSAHPSLVFSDSTPTGGDMGSHVWGPMYLLHHLLPQGRLSGWTPDWYDGFPAYEFYMVVPSLFVVAIHVGIRSLLFVPAALATVALGVSGWCSARLYRFRKPLLITAVVLAVLIVPVPYNVAFKLVTILGIVSLPAAAWAFGKLTDLPFPIPPLLTVGAVFFIYNREPQFNGYGNIIGGNMASTMAGEFAFSISLTFAVLYLGVAIRGLRTGRHRALAAFLFAMTGLCHLIPAFFVLTCTLVLFGLRPGRAKMRWLATMVPVAGLLTAFWALPFFWQRNYVNDMGWEKLPVANSGKSAWYYIVPSHLAWALLLAALGLVVSIIYRHAAGMVLGAVGLLVMVAFKFLPEARLWNARLLPFLYLCVFFLAAIAVGEVVRAVAGLAARDADRPLRAAGIVAVPVSACLALVVVGLPIDGLLPGQSRGADGSSHWLGRSTKDSNPVSSWAEWNYSGLEGKAPTPAGCGATGSATVCTSGGYPEYHDLVATMSRLGRDRRYGCGRAFWEYSKDRLDGYGTPMALMLLPYWTNGCIGSQEGLYFESSTTTPYHFLMQAELSYQGSNPQRNLPYPTLDLERGVEHLQMLGVRYYLATTTQAVAAARNQPALHEIAASGPWHVFQVADAPVVEGLRREPVVWRNVGDGQQQWLDPSIAWFLDPARSSSPFASSGPASWKRATFDGVPKDLRKTVTYVRQQLGAGGAIDQLPPVSTRSLPPVKVTGLRMSDDHLSFDVDRVGVPVLVKVSYFPNWKASGADGPYRVTPNLMVVVPRTSHVSMRFGRAPVDVASLGLTGAGILGLVVLWRLPPVDMPGPWRRRRRHRRRRWGDRSSPLQPLPLGTVLAEPRSDAGDDGESVALITSPPDESTTTDPPWQQPPEHRRG